MRALLTPLALSSSLSFAQPSAKVLEWVNSNYDPAITVTKMGVDLSLVGCWIEELRIAGKDPVTDQSRNIDVKVYHASAADDDAPTVLILPPTGGVNILDKGYANSFCNNGLRAVLITGWDHQLETDLDMGMHDRGAIRSLTAVRHVIEFLKPKRADQLGILGTSIGAIAGTLALGFDSRLAAGAMIVGSGRFADVVADSNERGALKLREARMKAYGLKSLEEYRAALKTAVITEPSDFVNYSGAKKSMIISASDDQTVRTDYQLELAELMKPQIHLHLSGDHLSVIKQSFFQHCSTITRFFKSNLK